MSTIVLRGKVFGKEARITMANSTRAILPLPAFMQVLDALIPMSLGPSMESTFPNVPDCFIGAKPKTQCLDIAHSLQFIIEKGIIAAPDAMPLDLPDTAT